MAKACVLLLALVAVHTATALSQDDLFNFLGKKIDLTANNIPAIRRALIGRVQEWASATVEGSNYKASPYPYFRFIPAYEASVIPDGPTVTFSAPCFQNYEVSAKTDPATGNVVISMNAQNASTWLCSDWFLLGTVDNVTTQTVMTRGVTTISWVVHPTSSDAVKWDLQTKGIRIFRFLDDFLTTIGDLLATLKLFESELTKAVSPDVAAANIDFMSKYTGFVMKNRTVHTVPIDKSLIKSGDFFGIVRLDGLDPLLAWAMGSTSGHTTVALWIEGELYICESTTQDSYWPTNGIQRTRYDVWLQQARDASYQVVWAPLAPELSAAFNATAALELLESLEGLDYGYRTLLWGWIDTVTDNYPCLPPDYKTCLRWEHVEVLFGMMDNIAPFVSDLLFTEAMNRRVNTTGLGIAGVLYEMGKAGLPANTLPTIVEQDVWDYNTTRNGKPAIGKSMVCCVFVCNIWKAGGVFDQIGREVNCAELTNWDDYSLAVFDSNFQRPAQCVAADPTNPLCQLEGEYTMELNNFNTKKMFPHMAEKCGGIPPDYKRDPDC